MPAENPERHDDSTRISHLIQPGHERQRRAIDDYSPNTRLTRTSGLRPTCLSPEPPDHPLYPATGTSTPGDGPLLSIEYSFFTCVTLTAPVTLITRKPSAAGTGPTELIHRREKRMLKKMIIVSSAASVAMLCGVGIASAHEAGDGSGSPNCTSNDSGEQLTITLRTRG